MRYLLSVLFIVIFLSGYGQKLGFTVFPHPLRVGLRIPITETRFVFDSRIHFFVKEATSYYIPINIPYHFNLDVSLYCVIKQTRKMVLYAGTGLEYYGTMKYNYITDKFSKFKIREKYLMLVWGTEWFPFKEYPIGFISEVSMSFSKMPRFMAGVAFYIL